MYVCICNAINVRKLQEAKEDGIRDADKLFEWCGVEVCCGQCTSEMNKLLQNEFKPNKNLKVA